MFQKLASEDILQFIMQRGCKLVVQSDTQSVHLEECLKTCQESGNQEFHFNQKPLTSVKERIEVKSPKKKREQKTSIAERIVPTQRSIYQLKNDGVKQKFNYNCLTVNSPLDTLINQMATQNKPQTNASSQGGGQFYQQTTVLRDIIKKYKIKSIVSNFIKKIKRVSVLRDPVQYTEFKKQTKGWEIPQTAQNILQLVTILQIVIFSLFYSLSLVYNELKNSQELLYIESLTCVSLALQILKSTKRSEQNQKISQCILQNVEIQGNIISNRRNRKGGQKQIFPVQNTDTDKSQETSLQKSMHLIHSTLRELTNEVIKQEINKLIRSDNYEDDVWMVKSDVLSDFNAYFPQHNPFNISSRYVELAELFRSENLLKAHTSVIMQHIQHNQFGRKVQPKKKLVRSLSIKKQQ